MGFALIALGAFRPDLVDWPQRDLVVMATYVAAQRYNAAGQRVGGEQLIDGIDGLPLK